MTGSAKVAKRVEKAEKAKEARKAKEKESSPQPRAIFAVRQAISEPNVGLSQNGKVKWMKTAKRKAYHASSHTARDQSQP